MKRKLFFALLVLFMLVFTLTATACGEHTHVFDRKELAEEYKLSDATCTQKAVYYYSCECGEKGTQTFEYGDALGHSFTNYISDNNATCTADGTKTAKCDRCDVTNTITDVNSKIGHSFTNYVFNGDATYDADGTKTALCNNGCGATDTITDVGTQLEGKIEFTTLSVSGDKVYYKVSNSTNFFSFIKEVKTYGSKTKFIVSYDAYGESQILTKTISLDVGDNIVYIVEMYDGTPKNVYQVTIRRKPIYNVSFNDANGTTIASQQVEEDAFAIKPTTNPTKLGYTFNGWDYNFSSPVAQDTVIAAKWNIVNYNIKYKSDGNKIATENPGTYTIEDAVTLSLPQVTKTGYTASWSDGGKIEQGSTGDKTFEVIWTPIEYTITYNLDDGTNNSNNPATYTIEDSITLQAPSKSSDVTSTDVATYAGDGIYDVEQLVTAYSFAGWYADENFENEVTTISGSGAVVLYACWSKNVTTSTIQQAYLRDDNYIYFGTYPQAKVVDDTLITSLNSLAGKLPTNANCQKWTSYLYFIGSVCNYMWYIDVEYSGARYRGVYFTRYRPYSCAISSSSSSGYQYTNGYYTSMVYWFKYEPIKWQILEESNGYATIIADLALDSQQYYHTSSGSTRTVNGSTVYENNYAESEIRSWLNDKFYDTAFNDLQKALIQTVTVDNSASSAKSGLADYACVNTNDKVWLLSYTEAFFKYSGILVRAKACTDYAKSQGCSTSTSSNYEGNCSYWWSRSPIGKNSASVITSSGSNDSESTLFTHVGVVPSLKIKMS